MCADIRSCIGGLERRKARVPATKSINPELQLKSAWRVAAAYTRTGSAVLVDNGADVRNETAVAWGLGTHVDPYRDVDLTTGPVDDAAILPADGGRWGSTRCASGPPRAPRWNV